MSGLTAEKRKQIVDALVRAAFAFDSHRTGFGAQVDMMPDDLRAFLAPLLEEPGALDVERRKVEVLTRALNAWAPKGSWGEDPQFNADGTGRARGAESGPLTDSNGPVASAPRVLKVGDVIQSEAEAAALPVGTVVKCSRRGDSWTKHPGGRWRCDGYRQLVMSEQVIGDTVTHIPAAEAQPPVTPPVTPPAVDHLAEAEDACHHLTALVRDNHSTDAVRGDTGKVLQHIIAHLREREGGPRG